MEPHKLIAVAGLLHLLNVEEVRVGRHLQQIADVAPMVRQRLQIAEVPVDLAALVVEWRSVANSLVLEVGISGKALKGSALTVSRVAVLIHVGMAGRVSSASEDLLVVRGSDQSSVSSRPVVATSAHRLAASPFNVAVRVRDRLSPLVPDKAMRDEMNAVMNVPDLIAVLRLSESRCLVPSYILGKVYKPGSAGLVSCFDLSYFAFIVMLAAID
ncbi:MAG: hypothetical protein QM703_23500 [Gemmatales bacterium]